MFSQTTTFSDMVVSTNTLKIPVGTNLDNSSRTLQPVDGSLALDTVSNSLYYGNNGVWQAVTSSQPQQPTLVLTPVGNSPNANGANLNPVGNFIELNLQPASQIFPGIVSTSNQVFSGIKSFPDGIIAPNGIMAGGTNYTSQPPIDGIDTNALLIDNTLNTITLEKASAAFPGIVSTTAQSFSGVKTFTNGIVSGGTNYTANIPVNATDTNGIIVNNVSNSLTLEEANGSFPGIVSTGAQSFAGVKTFTNGISVPGGITASGTNYTAAVPIVATNSDGIIVNNATNTITLETATASFPGIVSTTAQSFTGVKTFTNGIVSGGTNYTAAVPIVATNANGVIVNNTTNTITLEYADATHPGIISTGAQSFAGVKTFTNGIIVTGGISGTNYTVNAPTNGTDANGIIINNTTSKINLEVANASFPGILSTAAQNISGVKTFNNGIQVNSAVFAGSSALFSNYYVSSGNIPILWGQIQLFNPKISSNITCERIGNMIFINLNGFSSAVTGGSPGFLELATGSIPTPFRPTVMRGCSCVVISGNINFPYPNNTAQGWALIKNDGSMQIGASLPYGSTQNFVGIDSTGNLIQSTGPNSCGVISQTLMVNV